MAKRQTISKRTVDGLTCPVGLDRVFLWDDGLSGFGAVAFPSGVKKYVVQYRVPGRRFPRRMTLGTHGPLTPDAARRLAKSALGAVAEKRDPLADKRALSGKTFGQVAADYLAKYVKPKRKPRTYEEYDRLLRLHILPAIGSRTLSELRRPEIEKLHVAMENTPGAANHARVLIASIWNWAAKNDDSLPDRNPARALEPYRSKARERYLSTEELARFGAALRLAETKGIPWDVDESKPGARHVPKERRSTVFDPSAVGAILLLILTGARLREILHAKWSYVDWQRRLLLLPDSKSGQKTIYLADAAVAVLSKLRKLPGAGQTYIFAGRGARPKRKGQPAQEAPRADLKRPWDAIKRHARLENFRLHDLRHTFASTGVSASLGLPIIGGLLGHTQPSTTARYAHLVADPMHEAANLIGSRMEAALQISGPIKRPRKRAAR